MFRFVFLVIAAIAFSVHAGNIVPVSMTELSTDMTGQLSDVRDLLGHPCALIKVRIPTAGAEFGGVIKTEYRVGEYYVWIEDGLKMMEVRYPGCTPVMVTFASLMSAPAVTAPRTYLLSFDLDALEDKKGVVRPDRRYTQEVDLHEADAEAEYLSAREYLLIQEIEQGLELLTAAANRDYLPAMSLLGYYYYTGTNVKQDYPRAFEIYRRMVELGSDEALLNVAMCYAFGRGVERNDKEAVRYYRLSAEKGCAVAQFNLGQCYSQGRGVERDDAEAVRWYEMAAGAGDERALYNLAVCYYNGEGVTPDHAKAREYCRRSADKGYKPAIEMWKVVGR